MTRILLLSMIVIMAASRVEAIGGYLGVYSDQAGMQCDIYDTGPGMFSVYVVHSLSHGVSGISFTAAIPECATGVSWDSDESMFGIAIGDSQTGVTVLYGSGCVYSESITVMKINLIGSGMTPDCCLFPVEPFPGSVDIEAMDCDQHFLEVHPRDAIINQDYFICDCYQWIPVYSRSWGAIKALYQQ